MPPAKILVVGAPNGRVRDFFKRLSVIHKKNGPFDLILCNGDLFAQDEDDALISALLDDQIEVPTTTYFTCGKRFPPSRILSRASSQNTQICQNLFYLGANGITTTTEGVKIAYLGGLPKVEAPPTKSDTERGEDTEIETESQDKEDDALASTDAYFTWDDVQRLKEAKNVDILLTHAWPAHIARLSPSPPPASLTTDTAAITGLPIIASLSAHMAPRYHFAGATGLFWERVPYANPGKAHATRFVSLGDVFNKEKIRWFYAMNLIPTQELDEAALSTHTPDTTASPMEDVMRPAPSSTADGFFFNQGARPKRDRGPPPPTYTCHLCKQPGHWIQDCALATAKRDADAPGPERRDKKRRVEKGPCWFCLSSPDLAKHLVISIGEEAYLCIPKGPLLSPPGPDVDADPAQPAVPGGGHLLLIPIEHVGSLQAPKPGPLQAEVTRWLKAITGMFGKYDYVPLYFEVARRGPGAIPGAHHAHIQIIPIPKDKVPDVKAAFKKDGEENGSEWRIQESSETPVEPQPDVSLMRIVFPDGEEWRQDFAVGARFDVQIPRRILATWMGTPDRADWRWCMAADPAEERIKEEECAKATRDAFKPFDFTE